MTAFGCAALALALLYAALFAIVQPPPGNYSQHDYVALRSRKNSLSALVERAHEVAPLLSPDHVSQPKQCGAFWRFRLCYDCWYANTTITVTCQEDLDEETISCTLFYQISYPPLLTPIAVIFGTKRSVLRDYVRLLEAEFGTNLVSFR
jgi:hypothetical protein